MEKRVLQHLPNHWSVPRPADQSGPLGGQDPQLDARVRDEPHADDCAADAVVCAHARRILSEQEQPSATNRPPARAAAYSDRDRSVEDEYYEYRL